MSQGKMFMDPLRIGLASLTQRIVSINETKGWYDNTVPFLGAMALLHSEVSEAVEAWRKHGTKDVTDDVAPPGQVLPKPEGVGSEFADILIRLLDDCQLFGVDLVAEVERKLDYNETRSYRHGGKRA